MTTEDRYAWAIETARRLRNGEPVDSIAVAEEIEQMGRAESNELESRITQILEHMLKLYTANVALLNLNNGWEASIERQRNEIETLLEHSPSLKARITEELLEKCYRKAARVVAKEYEVQPPERCPFSVADVIKAR